MKHGKRKSPKKKVTRKRPDTIRRKNTSSNDSGKAKAGSGTKSNNKTTESRKRAGKELNKVNRKAEKNDESNRFNGNGNKKKTGATKKGIKKTEVKKTKKIIHAKRNENKRPEKVKRIGLKSNVKIVSKKITGVKKRVESKKKSNSKSGKGSEFEGKEKIKNIELSLKELFKKIVEDEGKNKKKIKHRIKEKSGFDYFEGIFNNRIENEFRERES